jgi:hypothetical protein
VPCFAWNGGGLFRPGAGMTLIGAGKMNRPAQENWDKPVQIVLESSYVRA